MCLVMNNPNSVCSKTYKGRTPAHFATYHGDQFLSQFLFDSCGSAADEIFNQMDDSEHSANTNAEATGVILFDRSTRF